jgi:hypothetical protein
MSRPQDRGKPTRQQSGGSIVEAGSLDKEPRPGDAEPQPFVVHYPRFMPLDPEARREAVNALTGLFEQVLAGERQAAPHPLDVPTRSRSHAWRHSASQGKAGP